MAGSWLPKSAVGRGGEEAAVDRWQEERRGEPKKKTGGMTPFAEFQCGAETPLSLVELSLLSH